MKFKLLLIILVFSSSVYAVDSKFMDNFTKAFNEYKTQIKTVCQAKQALKNVNTASGARKLQLDEIKHIRRVLWEVQKEKADAENSKNFDRIDDIKSGDLVAALLKNQGKEEKDISTALLGALNVYFMNLVEGIAKGRMLAQRYNELMNATDEVPLTIQEKRERLLPSTIGKPQVVQVAKSWKIEAEKMLQKCNFSDGCDKNEKCEKHLEFREGAAAYLFEHSTLEKYLSGVAVYSEMKRHMLDLENQITKQSDSDKNLAQCVKNCEDLMARCKNCSADAVKYLSNWEACAKTSTELQQKTQALIVAVEDATKNLDDPKIDSKQRLKNLKLAKDTILNQKESPESATP